MVVVAEVVVVEVGRVNDWVFRSRIFHLLYIKNTNYRHKGLKVEGDDGEEIICGGRDDGINEEGINGGEEEGMDEGKG
jgi:hypothetical protein